MFNNFIRIVTVTFSLTAGAAVSAAQFVVELVEPLSGDDTPLMQNLNVSEVERFDAEGKSYIGFGRQRRDSNQGVF